MSLISLKAMPVPDVNYLMAKSHYIPSLFKEEPWGI